MPKREAVLDIYTFYIFLFILVPLVMLLVIGLE